MYGQPPAHALVGTLKDFLRNQNQPLLQHYQDWLRISSIADLPNRLAHLTTLINNKLSTINRQLLAALITLVQKVCRHKSITNMTENSCAISLTPSLIWSSHSPDQDIKNVANFIQIIEDTFIYASQLFSANDLNWLQTRSKYLDPPENPANDEPQTTLSAEIPKNEPRHQPCSILKSSSTGSAISNDSGTGMAKLTDSTGSLSNLNLVNLPVKKMYSCESADDILSINSSGVTTDSGLSTSSKNQKCSSLDSLDLIDRKQAQHLTATSNATCTNKLSHRAPPPHFPQSQSSLSQEDEAIYSEIDDGRLLRRATVGSNHQRVARSSNANSPASLVRRKIQRGSLHSPRLMTSRLPNHSSPSDPSAVSSSMKSSTGSGDICGLINYIHGHKKLQSQTRSLNAAATGVALSVNRMIPNEGFTKPHRMVGLGKLSMEESFV